MPAYKDSDGRWRYRFAFRGKRYSGSTAKGHNTKAAAEKLERRHLEKLEARTFTGQMPTVAQFAEQFLSFQLTNTKPLTYELHHTIVNVHINPRIGKTAIDEVRADTIAKLMADWLAIPSARRTVNTRAGVLLRMLALAVEWGIVPMVPKVKLLKIGEEPYRFLSDPEGRELVAAASKARAPAGMRWRTMALVGLRAGLRIGEIRGLQRADIDLDGGAIRVCRTDPGRAELEAGTPKSGKMRVLPMTEELVEAMRAWLDELTDKAPAAWVFPADTTWTWRRSTRPRPIAESTCNDAISRAADRAKLKEVSWHTLRHTFASQLVMRGVPLRAVQELLGHATIKMTERYAHLSPGYASRALVAALDVPLMQPADLPKMLPEGSDNDRDVKPANVPRGTQLEETLPQTSGSQGAAKAPKRPRPTPRKPSQ
jgi:integrase